MNSIKFPYHDRLDIKMEYQDRLDIRMRYPDSINICVVIQNFAGKQNLENPHEIEMYLMHNKLIFGVDLFMLGQLDPLAFSAIDSLPLNVQ